MARERVDNALVTLGLCESLDMARALIMAGRVYQAEIKVNKASDLVKQGLPLIVRDAKLPFVSRGGLKLQKAMQLFDVDVQNHVCIDVGSSTGGFTDCMLQAGARRVYAVDVGYGQLDYKLRNDPRVQVMERTNARFIQPEQFDPSPSFGATDVSFISLKAILPSTLQVLRGENRRFVALIKPQFEALPHQVGAKGVVRDPAVHFETTKAIADFVPSISWTAHRIAVSPIKGPEGNIEFLLDLFPCEAGVSQLTDVQISDVVQAAYDNFVKSAE